MKKLSPFARLVLDSRYKNRKPGQPAVTVAATAERCGVSRQYLFALMNGSRGEPTLPVLERLSAGLGVSISRLRQAFAEAPPVARRVTRAKAKR